MKHLLLSVGLLLWTHFSYAQTDQLNQDKYWKFRNNYKEKFMRIGSSFGQSLPARSLVPLLCFNNSSGNWDKGMMKWGDAMIRHGHYLTLLATEYRLLKNNGQNDQAQATLNELYYALWAVHRLDWHAEENQDPIYSTNIHLYENVNGFYNREDVVENFASDNWGSTSPMGMECTYGAYYTNNNTAKINDPANNKITKGNSYQNTPSMDQTSPLLVGLAMVVQLVDNVTVQPSPSDIAIDVRQWASDQIYFIVKNIAYNNWFMIDVNGWPVNNEGGDAFLFAIPLAAAVENWGGGHSDLLPDIAYRQIYPYKGAQAYATGYDLNGPFDTSQPMNPYEWIIYSQIVAPPYTICGPNNEFARNTRFLQWQRCGYTIHVKGASNSNLQWMWQNYFPNNYYSLGTDWADNQKLDGTFGAGLIGDIKLDHDPFKNSSIMFNMGVLSGLWNNTVIGNWGAATGDKSLELINSFLHPSQSPPNSAAHYKAFLDNLDFTGPYHLTGDNDGYPPVVEKYAANGWAGEYRWPDLAEANGTLGEEGIYSALDYMVMYNLYHLKFGASTPSIPAYKESWSCNCDPTVTASGSGGADYQNAYTRLNAKLQYLNTCQDNVFYPVANLVGGIFNIEPKFPDYPSWGIYTTKYQTDNASVLPGGEIHVKTRFVVCTGTLNIQTGGRLDIYNKEMIVNTNGRVDVNGIMTVGTGTTLTLKSGSILRLKNGGKLKVEPGGQLIIEPGATIEYYNGAELILADETSQIIHGGTIVAKDATTFSIISQSTTANKGKLIINSATAAFSAEQQPTYFNLIGYGVNDPFITINQNAKLSINDPDITVFKIADCSVEFKDAASMRVEEFLTSQNVTYFSSGNNGGITITDGHNFTNCKFNQVPVKAMMSVENKANFSAWNCQFTAPNSVLNPGDLSLLKVNGMGMSVQGCSFITTNKHYGIQSSAMTRSSIITNSTFSQYGTANGSTMIGINDNSNVEISVSKSSFDKAQYGIYKSSGKLSLKCNTFSNNYYCNVKVLDGCTLNMSVGDLAGYNTLKKSLQNRNIEITACPVNLKSGYNFIEECPYTIVGTTTLSCTPPGCFIDLTKNQWNTGNTVPSTSNFQILTASNNYIVTPTTSPVAAQTACGYYDGTIPLDPPKTKSTFDNGGMPIIWSTTQNDSIRLSQAIINAMESMTSYDSLGNDLVSLELFNEVFASDVDPNDSLTRNYLWYALDYMKSTLENAFTNNQISYTQNEAEFESHVAMYANALRLMTDPVINEENYRTQFYHEIDKAHLFRVIGKPQIGLNILEQLERCGIDSTEQAQINYWKTVFQGDLIIEEVGMEILDTTIVVDTSDFIAPQLNVNQYSFGAIINDMNNIVYPNCDFFHTKDLIRQRSLKQINAYPNPAHDLVNIQVVSDVDGAGTLTVELADDRKIYSKSVDIIKENEFSLNVSNWNSGMYLVTVTFADGKQITTRLAIK